jgi:hypothetical protein
MQLCVLAAGWRYRGLDRRSAPWYSRLMTTIAELGSFWPGRPAASELPVVESAASADLDPTAVAETNGTPRPG